MSLNTIYGVPIEEPLVENYFRNLVNLFFKILPIRENEETTLAAYMKSLLVELIGCRELIVEVHNDAAFLTLLATLQYLIDHPEAPVSKFRSEVFKSISICNKLRARYCAVNKGGVAQ